MSVKGAVETVIDLCHLDAAAAAPIHAATEALAPCATAARGAFTSFAKDWRIGSCATSGEPGSCCSWSK